MIRISESHDYDLVGELIDMPETARARQESNNPFAILPSTTIPRSSPEARVSADPRA